jgi:hypothetical protein
MKRLAVLAAVTGGLLLPAVQAQSATEAGVLECNVAGGVGLIVGSEKALSCRYQSADGKISEPYEGTITKVGVDIGITGKSVVVWTVLAPTSSLRPGALDGTYSGVSGQATVGVGASANVLIGGSDKTISLQPLSVGAQTGLNVAAGIGSITLRSPTR